MQYDGRGFRTPPLFSARARGAYPKKGLTTEITESTEGFTEKGQSDDRLVLSGIRSLIPDARFSRRQAWISKGRSIFRVMLMTAARANTPPHL